MVVWLAKYSCYLKSRVVWDCNSNKGDRFHLKLNILGKPIAKKYCEGKVKRTLKKEWKEHEIVMRGTWFDLFRSHWKHSIMEKSVVRLLNDPWHQSYFMEGENVLEL